MTFEILSVNAQPENAGSVTWFVDEAGDPTLFGKGGKVVASTEGCSLSFIAGKLECRDVNALTADLERLRKDVVADPFFKDVPSRGCKKFCVNGLLAGKCQRLTG